MGTTSNRRVSGEFKMNQTAILEYIKCQNCSKIGTLIPVNSVESPDFALEFHCICGNCGKHYYLPLIDLKKVQDRFNRIIQGKYQ